jgi:hypothetical protein
MALPATDSFTGVDSSPLNPATWTLPIGNFILAGNHARGAGGTLNVAVWTGDNFEDDHYAEMTVFFVAGQGAGPMVCVDSVTGNGYALIIFGTGANNAQINTLIAGANTPIGTPFSVTSGATVRLSHRLGTVTAYLGAVVKDTFADATFTTGQAGMHTYFAGELDSFTASNESDFSLLSAYRRGRFLRQSRRMLRAARGR